MNAPDEPDPIGDLAEAWEDAYLAGRDIPPEVLCRDRPELADQVREVVAGLRFMHGPRRTRPAPAADAIQYRSGGLVGGRFRLEAELARGSSAVVWRAWSTFGGRAVAVKLPVPRPGHTREQTARRLRGEGRRALNLFHPHIVPVYDFGGQGDDAYIVLRLVAGGTLRERLRRAGPLAPAEARAVARQLASALAYLHERGTVHRDLKPENVLLDHGGRAFLTDFGIALSVGQAADGCANYTGTFEYMAPEQRAGGALGPTCDVFSFGVVLWEALTGERPPRTTAGAPAPAGTGALIPDALRGLLERCLRADPAERYPDGTELALALRAVYPPEPLPPEPPKKGPLAFPPPIAPAPVVQPPAPKPIELNAELSSPSPDTPPYWVRRTVGRILFVCALVGVCWPALAAVRPDHAGAGLTAFGVVAVCLALGLMVARPSFSGRLGVTLGMALIVAAIVFSAVEGVWINIVTTLNAVLSRH